VALDGLKVDGMIVCRKRCRARCKALLTDGTDFSRNSATSVACSQAQSRRMRMARLQRGKLCNATMNASDTLSRRLYMASGWRSNR